MNAMPTRELKTYVVTITVECGGVELVEFDAADASQANRFARRMVTDNGHTRKDGKVAFKARLK
ncbi:hypothetical protein [Pseudomonas sp. MWU12-2323]|uniref:hypothetical protein n=1 Tax=Pseudomonas sp. MWU12-2323 TaxID=2651296 RepID=UPI00128B7C90|nr:hypothetical protein [Pseudomonas sp. MWU12-2323]MPQ69471.1 hypothetical protein [Pseudomonas sp. MWU12-2323]